MKKNLEAIYAQYKEQIDAILKHPGMKGRQAGRIVAFFYGGSANGWRNFLATKARSRKIPKEVSDLLTRLAKGK